MIKRWQKKVNIANAMKKTWDFGNLQNEATELTKKSTNVELTFPKIGEEIFILSFYSESTKI